MTTGAAVLLIDDDDAFRFAMRKALQRLGHRVTEARSGDEALSQLRGETPPDVALLDLRMEGMDGLEVLRRRRGNTTPIIVLTGHGSVSAAVEAMRLGAFSFLEKPVDADALGPLLAQAVRSRASSRNADAEVPPLVGVSKGMQDLRDFIARVGPTNETVAVYGETGAGKEIVARNIHAQSSRRAGPFVALNAATIPRDLFESELFGHRKGSFTGATSDHAGLFRDADGGTLFIDEVGELPIDSQAKLLRALETKSVRSVGGAREERADARIVVATNRDLRAEVRAGRFREDLFFRLEVFPIVIAPLRARREDVIPLARHLLSVIGGGFSLSDDAEQALVAYDWPGNGRELMNVLRRACLFAGNQEIDGDTVRRMLAASVFAHTATHSAGPGTASPAAASAAAMANATTNLAELEKAHILAVLGQVDGNVTRAAERLGIDRRTLQRKMRGFGMDP